MRITAALKALAEAEPDPAPVPPAPSFDPAETFRAIALLNQTDVGLLASFRALSARVDELERALSVLLAAEARH